jgi:hypothetical protein
LQYGVTWETSCWDDFVSIYGGDEKDALESSRALEWRLSRNPFLQTRRLTPESDVYLTSLGPFKDHPAVALSFRIELEEHRQHCVLEKTRRTNAPDGLS